jgi:muconolactone delta-isomerase
VEFLVNMTTSVPEGTVDETIQDVRNREAAHSRELAAHGHLLRLWRLPLRAGEWRTLGLFAAEGDGRLGQILASMPLRIWRSNQVTPLLPHPNDPPPAHIAPVSPEFLTGFVITIPGGTPADIVSDTTARERSEPVSWPKDTSPDCGPWQAGQGSGSRWAYGKRTASSRRRRSSSHYPCTPGRSQRPRPYSHPSDPMLNAR